MTANSEDPFRDRLAFCTIVSKNYLAQVRVLAKTLQIHHPHSRLFVLLVDRVEGYFNPKAEPFEVIPIEDLPIAELPRFCFQYTVLELNTAAKPYFLRHLFERYGLRKLVYFDPDIMVLANLRPLAKLLDRYSIIVTPHLTAPFPKDGKRTEELDILLAGTFNLGFLALAAGPTVTQLLGWWEERLFTGCQMAIDRGMHVDQKWIDLVPGFFPDVHILRDPGYNAAYWNLHCRRVEVRENKVLINGEPGYFFHFSGFDPNWPQVVSRHQNRFTMDDIGDARHLYARYAEALFAQDHGKCANWPYFFGTFDNGVAIPSFARLAYLNLGVKAATFGNPFQTGKPNSFYRWLTTPGEGGYSPLFLEMHRLRKDLVQAFPDIHGRDRQGFLNWAATNAVREYQLDERLLLPNPVTVPKREKAANFPLVYCGPAGGSRPFGVNLAGYFLSEKGTGESVRTMRLCLDAVSIPLALNNLPEPWSANQDQSSWDFTEDNPYAVNLIHVNADMAPIFAQERAGYLKGHYNIGYWAWELAEFPHQWRDHGRFFDEIWVPSTFNQNAVAAVVPRPVHRVPHAIALPPKLPPGFGRKRFDLPAHAFVFLFAFDYQSYLPRKNPAGLVQAFRQAFGDRRDVLLVLKTVHADQMPVDGEALLAACKGHRNIRLIDEVLDRQDMLALMMLCDAYVSLHRGEGFGLTLAEAMAMGKPVIATGYSANLDWMNLLNSRLIRNRLVPIDKNYGPYRRGALWAEPDIDHAAEEMRRLVADREAALKLGQQAQQDIALWLSPSRVGQLAYSRLLALTRPALRKGIALDQGGRPRLAENIWQAVAQAA